MKLDSDMLERALDQFEAEALPDDHPVVPKLNEVFGEHTFFLDDDGLHIIEPAEPAQDGELIGDVVRVARWGDADRSSLALQEPRPTGISIDLGSGSSGARA
jgi:hypothetical protein